MSQEKEMNFVTEFLRLWHGLHMPSIIFASFALFAASFVVEWMLHPSQATLPNEAQVAIITVIVTTLVVVPFQIVKSRTKPPKEDDIRDKLLEVHVEHMTLLSQHLILNGGVDQTELKRRLGKIADDVENVP